jgi:hypothetical protein
MLEDELVFLPEKNIQNEGFSNLWKRRVLCRDHVLSSSLCCEGFDVDEEINNMMNGTPKDNSNGYKSNIFNEVSSDGTLRKVFSNSMNERWNEERNGEED